MKKNRKKSLLTLKNRAISLALLVGFLSIQFHSFSHSHFDVLEAHDDSYKVENSTFDTEVNSETYSNVLCTVCLLTKHLNSDINQYHSSSLPLSLQVLDININEPFSNFDLPLFNLRAPPFNVT